MHGSREDCVTLQLIIAGQELAAFLDTGAKPSVIDLGTVKRLGLEEEIREESGRVYGLCKSPVQVKSSIEIPIQIGDEKPQVSRLQVLESEEPTLLLGRSFMRNFGSVLFDRDRSIIRLGDNWIEIYSTAAGGDPLFRAQTSVKEEKLESVAHISFGFGIDSGLSREKYTEMVEI